jgi:hypothetical protein
MCTTLHMHTYTCAHCCGSRSLSFLFFLLTSTSHLFFFFPFIPRCVAAEPRYGELWQPIAKDPANAHTGPGEILLKVAAETSKIALG